MMPCAPGPHNEQNTQHLVSTVKTLADMNYGIEVWGPGDGKGAVESRRHVIQLCMSTARLDFLSPMSFIHLEKKSLYVAWAGLKLAIYWPQSPVLPFECWDNKHVLATIPSFTLLNRAPVMSLWWVLTYFWNVDFPFDILMKAMYLHHSKR